MRTICCLHVLYLRKGTTLLSRLVSISLQWDVSVLPPCAKALCCIWAQGLRGVGQQSPGLPIHWLTSVCCSYQWTAKAWQGRTGGLGRVENPSFCCRPKCLWAGRYRGAGGVRAQGGNSPAPTTLLEKPLCRAHVREKMSEQSPSNSGRKAVGCRITLWSMRSSGRSFFCFCWSYK